MTFEQAKQSCIDAGYREQDIRRIKAHLSEPWDPAKIAKLNASTKGRRTKLQTKIDESESASEKARLQRQLTQCQLLPDDAGVGVFNVFEDGPDQPAARLDGAEFTEKAEIIRYRLNQGTLASSNREFWVPCAYDGNKGWEAYYCAPDWIETTDEQKAFCDRHYGQRPWPDEKGEVAEDPIRFINGELLSLRSAHKFKSSSELDQKFHKESVCNMRRHSEQAFEYLSKAVEISLKRNEPKHRQVSQHKLRNNGAINDFVDHEAVRIIELAFRAGREAATSSLHCRGVPQIAQAGERRVATGFDGRKRKSAVDLTAVEKRGIELIKIGNHSMEEVFDILREEKLLKIHKKGLTVKPLGRSRFIKKKSFWDHLKALENRFL